jgi:hypothetical protein
MDILTLPPPLALIGPLFVAAVAVGTIHVARHWRQDKD